MQKVLMGANQAYVDAVTRADKEKGNTKRMEFPFSEIDGLEIVKRVGTGHHAPNGAIVTALAMTIPGR